MEKIYPLFPLTARVLPAVTKTLVISVVIYVVICSVLSILQFALGWIPLVGWIVRTVCSLIGLYCVAGIILSFLKYFWVDEV